MLTLRLFIFLSILLNLITRSYAEDLNSLDINWKKLSVGFNAISQSSGFSSGPLVRYSPYYRLSSELYVGASADVSYAKLDTNTSFYALGLMAFVGYDWNEKISIQFNTGTQNWTCSDCGSALVLGPSVAYDISNVNFAGLNHIWAAYLPVFKSDIAHSVQLGVGFQF